MRKHNGSGLIAGIILIAFGLLLLGDNLNLLHHLSPDFYFPSFRLFSWPVILLVIGAIILANDSRSVFGWVMVGLGGLNIASRFFYFSVGDIISDFWPLILIVVGLVLLLKRRDRSTLYFNSHDSHHKGGFKREFHDEIKKEFHGLGDEIRQEFQDMGREVKNDIRDEFKKEFHDSRDANDPYADSSDTVDIVSIFNSVKRRVVSGSFRGGKITSVFGSSDVYLTESKLAEGEQVIDIAAIFGSVDIYVPKDWRVIVKTTAIFGGFDDSRFYQMEEAKTGDRALVVKGFVLFGGGDIKN